MLEEIGFDYKVTKLDLAKGDQFKPEFKKISPFAKIPAIIDHSNNNQSVFESGAILIYLAERSGKLYDQENKLNIDQWLMAQMGSMGPFIGQYHYFYKFNKGLIQKTLPIYLKKFKKPKFLVVNVDVDLYTATLFILCNLKKYIPKNNIFIFDEFATGIHEFRAFKDFVDSYGIRYKLISSSNDCYSRVAIKFII